MTRRLFFYLSILHYEAEWSPVIRLACEAGRAVTILLGWSGPSADEAAERFAVLGARVLRVPAEHAFGDPKAAFDAVTAAGNGPAVRPRFASLKARAVPWLQLVRSVRALRRQRAFAHQVLTAERPDVLVVGVDQTSGGIYHGLLLTAEVLGIPSVGLPFTVNVTTRATVHAAFLWRRQGYSDPRCELGEGRFDRLLARLFPRWVRGHDGVCLFRWTPLGMLAARLAGTLESDPWRWPSARLTHYLAFTPRSAEMVLSEGYPAERVTVCGVPRLDDVAAAAADPERRKATLGALGMEGSPPFVLWNMEPSWEHGYCPAEQHWAFVRNMAETLSETGLPVVISLHPLCRLDNYRFLEDRPGFVISRDCSIFALYPLCAFAVSFLCSTDFLADVFHKPLVIVDRFERYHPSIPAGTYYQFEGSVLVETEEETRRAVTRIARAAASPSHLEKTALGEYRPAAPSVLAELDRLSPERNR